MDSFRILCCFFAFICAAKAQPVFIPWLTDLRSYRPGDSVVAQRLDTSYYFAVRHLPYPRMPQSRKGKPHPFSLQQPELKNIKKEYKSYPKESKKDYEQRIERVYSVRLENYWKQQAQYRAQEEAFRLDSIRYEQDMKIYADSVKLYEERLTVRLADSVMIADEVVLFFNLLYRQQQLCTNGFRDKYNQWISSWLVLDQELAALVERSPSVSAKRRYEACRLDTLGFAQVFAPVFNDTVCWYSPQELEAFKYIVYDYRPNFHPEISDVYSAWRQVWQRWRPSFARVNEVQDLLEQRQRAWLALPLVRAQILRWIEAKRLARDLGN